MGVDVEYIPKSTRPTESIRNTKRLIEIEELARNKGELYQWVIRARFEIDTLNAFIREGYERLVKARTNYDEENATHILNLSGELIKARDYLENRVEALSATFEQSTTYSYVQPKNYSNQQKVVDNLPTNRNGSLFLWIKRIAGFAIVGFLFYSCLAPKTYSPDSNQTLIPTRAYVPAPLAIGTSIPTCTTEDTKYLDAQHKLIAEINRVSPEIDKEITRAINNKYLARSESWRKSTFDLINQFGMLVDELGGLTPSQTFLNGHRAQLDDLYKSYQSNKASYIALTAPSEARINEAIAALTEADFAFQRASNVMNKESCMRISYK